MALAHTVRVPDCESGEQGSIPEVTPTSFRLMDKDRSLRTIRCRFDSYMEVIPPLAYGRQAASKTVQKGSIPLMGAKFITNFCENC